MISTKLLAGRTIAHVYSDAKPGPGFEPSEPDLEDVYFSTMAGPRSAVRRGRRRAKGAPRRSGAGRGAPASDGARGSGTKSRRMKFREIFRFELAYQARRVSTWVYFVVLFAFGFLIMLAAGADTPEEVAFLNAPNGVAFLAVMGVVIWLLLAGAVAGEAGRATSKRGCIRSCTPRRSARPTISADDSSRPSSSTRRCCSPCRWASAALFPPAWSRLARPVGHLAAYFVIALPTAFAATAIQFCGGASDTVARWQPTSRACSSSSPRRSQSGWRGSFSSGNSRGWSISSGSSASCANMEASSPIERNTRLFALEGLMLANRLVWIGVGMGALAITYRRFRFGPLRCTRAAPDRFARREQAACTPDAQSSGCSERLVRPRGSAHGSASRPHARQTLAIGWTSFRAIAWSRTGLTLVGALAFGSAFVSTEWMLHMEEIPLLPRTEEVLAFYAPSLRSVRDPLDHHPAAHRLLRRRAGLARARRRRERDRGHGAGAGVGPLPRQVPRPRSRRRRVDGVPVGGRNARAGRSRAIPSSTMRTLPDGPLRISARRLPPLRAARPRRARGRGSEARRATSRRSSPMGSSCSRRGSASSTSCSSMDPISGGRTRR